MLIMQEGVQAMVSDSQPTYCIHGDNYFNKKVMQTVNAGSCGRWRNVYDGPTVRYDGVSEQEHNKVLSLACIPENGPNFLDNRPSLAIFSPVTRLKTVLMSAIIGSSILAVNLGGGLQGRKNLHFRCFRLRNDEGGRKLKAVLYSKEQKYGKLHKSAQLSRLERVARQLKSQENVVGSEQNDQGMHPVELASIIGTKMRSLPTIFHFRDVSDG
ncbi:hypothetical protein B0H19DRAFT_1085348 [Mycena capillaripes]|nr:hypothetical protein B0H19DRAFT_1085348 [Mycena capillaripes]